MSSRLQKWLSSYERRKTLFKNQLDSQESLRLVHNEGTPLRVDKLGDVAVLGWWDETPPTDSEWSDLKSFLQTMGFTEWVFCHHSKSDKEKKFSDSSRETWTGLENGIVYEFRRDQGVSCGLFLDQRDQRRWLREKALNKNVLNLFAYTGGFSVAAALGGAASVVTVDVSSKYLEWSKKNFELNGLSTKNYKFHAMDSLEYLAYAARKNLRFDFIVCDPPSHSRNKGQDFRIDRDFPELIQAMNQILNPQGTIMFSSNFEKWSGDFWNKKLQDVGAPLALKITPRPHSGGDFEEDPAKSLMKAFHLEKK